MSQETPLSSKPRADDILSFLRETARSARRWETRTNMDAELPEGVTWTFAFATPSDFRLYRSTRNGTRAALLDAHDQITASNARSFLLREVHINYQGAHLTVPRAWFSPVIPYEGYVPDEETI